MLVTQEGKKTHPELPRHDRGLWTVAACSTCLVGMNLRNLLGLGGAQHQQQPHEPRCQGSMASHECHDAEIFGEGTW